MRPAIFAFVLGPALLWPSLATAQAQAETGFELSGTSRLRYEVIEGQARTGADPGDDLLSVRTTLAARYATPRVRFVAELYDSRAYLEDPGTPLSTNEVNALELVQAYVAGDIAAGRGAKVTLTAGRFLLNLGSRRLVAADEYRNTTNSYTGLRADLAAGDGWSATAIYTLPQLRLPDARDSLRHNAVEVDRESFDLVLWGGLAAKARAIGPAMLEAGYFHLGERDAPGRPTRNRSLDTASLRLLREPAPGAVDYEVEAIYQWGTIRAGLAPDAATLDVSASFVHAEIGYTFPAPWQPRLSLEFDRASGDAQGGRYGRFDTLFGMRRAELAPAGLYNAVGRANLASPMLRLEVTPDKRTDAFLAVRPLWLAERTDAFSTTGVRDASGSAGSYAGLQLDSRVRYWLLPGRLRLEADAVWLGKGRFLKEAPNAPSSGDTRYLSLNATVSF